MADGPESDARSRARVTDGLDVDWDAALEGAPAEQRRLLEQLRLLSNISRASGLPPGIESVERHASLGPVRHHRRTRPRVLRPRLPGARHAGRARRRREAAAGGLRRRGPGLLEEARALAKVRHPNVLTVYGADRFDGVAGLWTEFVEGQTLEQIVNTWGTARRPRSGGPRRGRSARRCRPYTPPGLVHRDVTARNVMREHGGRTVLLDFGGVSGRPTARPTADRRHAALPGAGALRGRRRRLGRATSTRSACCCSWW